MSTVPALKNNTAIVPEFLHTNETFTKFIDYYIEYLSSNYAFSPAQRFNLDELDPNFVSNFKDTLLKDIPGTNAIKTLSDADIINLAKNIIAVNKNKGTFNSIKYMFRVLFGKEAEIEGGKLGLYQETKPLDFLIVETDSSGTPIAGESNLFSNQDFIKLGDDTVTGKVRTIFLDGTDVHFWVDGLSGVVQDGDILKFPIFNKYAKVLATNSLELDGWLGKDVRWLDGNDFYVKSQYNPKLYEIYPDLLYGTDYFVQYDSYGNLIPPPSFAPIDFISTSVGFLNSSLMLETDLVSDFYNNTIQQAIDATNLVGFGTLNDSFVLSFTAAGTGSYSHHFEFTWNGTVYYTDITFYASAGICTKILVNGIDIGIDPASSISYKMSMSEWINSDTSLPVVSASELDYRLRRIAIFTYVIAVDMKSTDYIPIIRNTVFPAGFNIVPLYRIVGMAERDSTTLIHGTETTPSLELQDTALSSLMFDTWYPTNDITVNLDSMANAFNFQRWSVQDIFDAIHDSNTKSELPITLESWEFKSIGDAIAEETDYFNGLTADRDAGLFVAPSTQIITV